MDLSELKYKISRLAFFIGSFKYKRNKNLYLSFFLIAMLISAAAFGIYLYQKNEIIKKENILKSYFAELKGNNAKDDSASNSYGNNINSPDKPAASSGSKSAGSFSSPTVSNTGKEQKDDIPGENADTAVQQDGSISGSQKAAGGETLNIKVYICGYVKNPGVYELGNDARIDQLLIACGGAAEKACLEAVNLAKKLNDGEMVYIPSVEEVVKDGSFFDYIGSFAKDSQSGSVEQNEPGLKLININTASAGELESLPGIGEIIAKDIVTYRETYGPFKSREELKNVKGIGDKKFEKVKELISI